jgi:hypothetical protein
MSITAMKWVFDSYVADTPAKKLVMLVLADHSNDDGLCWPSIETIGRRANGISKRYVKQLLADLEKDSQIVRVSRFKDNEQRSNYYILVLGKSLDAIASTMSAEYGIELEGVIHRSPPSEPQITPGVLPSSPRGCSTDHPEPSLEPPENPHRISSDDEVRPVPEQTSGSGKEIDQPDWLRKINFFDWISIRENLNWSNWDEVSDARQYARGLGGRTLAAFSVAEEDYWKDDEVDIPQEEEGVAYEDVVEDGTPASWYAKNAKRIKSQTELEGKFLRACQVKYFKGPGERARFARVEKLVKQQDEARRRNPTAQPEKYTREYVEELFTWAGSKNEVKISITTSALLNAIESEQNWNRYVAKKNPKGGTKHGGQIIGSTLHQDSGN